MRVSERLAVSASRELLADDRAATRALERMLLVLGYAGWGPGQLDAEISQGAWIPVDFDERIVFDTPFEERWSTALRILGIDPARLSHDARRPRADARLLGASAVGAGSGAVRSAARCLRPQAQPQGTPRGRSESSVWKSPTSGGDQPTARWPFSRASITKKFMRQVSPAAGGSAGVAAGGEGASRDRELDGVALVGVVVVELAAQRRPWRRAGSTTPCRRTAAARAGVS